MKKVRGSRFVVCIDAGEYAEIDSEPAMREVVLVLAYELACQRNKFARRRQR